MSEASVEPTVVTDPRIDDSAFALDGVDTSASPQFTVSEVAKVFFARSPHWVRWLEKKGAFCLDSQNPECNHQTPSPDGGKVATSLVDEHGVCSRCHGVMIETRRTDKGGARIYSLGDIERLAHALAQHHSITGAQLHNALLLVHTEARVWGYLG